MPCWPIFIPSKGRPYIKGVGRMLSGFGIHEFTFIVEPDEREQYANRWGTDRVAVLPRRFQLEYETCDGFGESIPLGSGPSRNFAWHLAKERGADWHWIIDDNVLRLYRYDGKKYTVVSDGKKWFREAERFITSYRNVGMGGPHDEKFVVRGQTSLPTKNTRIYSFNLIRTALPYRWRGRYNEDTILTLDMLSRHWCTILLRHLLMDKAATWHASDIWREEMQGGNTDKLYRHGTGPKSRMLARVYPQYVEVVHRHSRIHHLIKYKKHFGHIPLVPSSPEP